jgi:hypothetical protein
MGIGNGVGMPSRFLLVLETPISGGFLFTHLQRRNRELITCIKLEKHILKPNSATAFGSLHQENSFREYCDMQQKSKHFYIKFLQTPLSILASV